MDDELDPTIAARFSVLEQLEPPDAWSRIAGETDVVEFDRVPTPDDRHRSRPLLVAAAVLLVVAAGVVVVSRTGGDDPEVVPPESPSANSGAGPPSAATAQTASPSSIAETPDFGRAEIAPDVIRPGDEITITPARPVQNICTQLGGLYSIADQSIVGIVAKDGRLTPGPDITLPGCIGKTTDEALTYVVPDELDDGRYILCVSDELTRDGCATFSVDRDAPDAPPAFGIATVEPEIVAPGDQLTITPLRKVQGTCPHSVRVYTTPGQDLLGTLTPDGDFPRHPLEPTCLPAPTAEPATNQVPDALADGTYIACVSYPRTAPGCGTFTVRRSPLSSTTTFPDLTTTTYPGVAPDTFLACLDLFAFATTEEGDTALVVDFDGDQMNADRTERIDLPSDRLTVEVLVGRHVDAPLCNDLPGDSRIDQRLTFDSGTVTIEQEDGTATVRFRNLRSSAHSDLRVPIDSFTARIGAAGG